MLARVLLVMFCHAACCDAAAIASGRNWRISIQSLDCEAAGSVLTMRTRIEYRGPRGPVEAPVSRLVDGKGKPYLPRSLVWTSGSKPLAELLSSGGLRNIQAENSSEIQLKFDVRGATGSLSLEFGDIRAFSLSRKRASVCEGLLTPEQIQAPRTSRPARVEHSKLDFPVYRARYPCRASMIEAEYPPYVPRQLLLFGRGYLPGARQIELPMGTAPAQPYFYVGPDDFIAVEHAARRALLADFPEYASGSKYFAFNWGTQKAQSGNDLYSIGIYEVRACPK